MTMRDLFDEYEERQEVPVSDTYFMSLNEYQNKAYEFTAYNDPLIYPALGLVSEAGEVADKIKKSIRDQGYALEEVAELMTQSERHDLALELGDCLWYIAQLADDLQMPLSDIAEMNINKLSDRRKRKAMRGSGDYR